MVPSTVCFIAEWLCVCVYIQEFNAHKYAFYHSSFK